MNNGTTTSSDPKSELIAGLGELADLIPYMRSGQQGVVKEDRGPIGVKGRHLYLVDFRTDPQSPSQIELPAEQLETANWATAVP